MHNSVIGEAPITERTVAEIPPRGTFSLQAAAEFGFGANEGRPPAFDGAMLSVAEPKVLAHAARFYGLHAPPGHEQFAELAERWQPFRTWTTVLIRPAGNREARTPPRRAAPGRD